MPQHLRRKLRTTNVIEPSFVEGRSRTRSLRSPWDWFLAVPCIWFFLSLSCDPLCELPANHSIQYSYFSLDK
jgi:hypothetical protein